MPCDVSYSSSVDHITHGSSCPRVSPTSDRDFRFQMVGFTFHKSLTESHSIILQITECIISIRSQLLILAVDQSTVVRRVCFFFLFIYTEVYRSSSMKYHVWPTVDSTVYQTQSREALGYHLSAVFPHRTKQQQ